MSDGLALRVDLKEVADYTRVLATFPQVTAEESALAMRAGLDTVEAAVAGFTPVNSGGTRAAITTAVYGSGANLTGEVSLPVIHGEALEYGRKPGKRPPVAAIELWVRRKGIGGQDARQVAFLIARAIGRRGTKGAFMFKKGFDASKGAVIRRFEEVPGRVVARMER